MRRVDDKRMCNNMNEERVPSRWVKSMCFRCIVLVGSIRLKTISTRYQGRSTYREYQTATCFDDYWQSQQL